MHKQALLDQVIKHIKDDLSKLRKAAAETHKSSTSEESKQEGKYDTRGLEASYLAEAQASQVLVLENGLRKLQQLTLSEELDTATLGSVVILSGIQEHQYFLLPAGGGFHSQYEGEPITVVTPDSPIGSMILGGSIADQFESKKLGEVFISEIY